MQSIYQVNTITSAMFQTSMAGNTLVAALALQSFGIGITWGDWAMAAIVPGIIALIINGVSGKRWKMEDRNAFL